MSFGVTTQGFQAKTLTDIKAELEALFQASFGASIDLSSSSVFGQLIGIMSERFSELWEVSQAVYSAFDPDQAENTSLESLAALTGTARRAARPSTAFAVATGTPNTILPIGRIVSVETTGARFQSTEEVTLLAAPDWKPLTAFILEERVSNNGNVYEAVIAGVSAAGSGPSGEGDAIIDASVTWRFLGNGTGVADVTFSSVETAPIVALAGTLNQIETPVAGWQNIINLLDATLGAKLESDAALRLRREEELVQAASATLEAIRTDILQVENVIAVTVFENVTNITNSDGLPPKSIEALVQGGDDQEVREAIFATIPAGIETHGTLTGTVEDSQGILHTIKFSRPVQREVIVTISLVKDPLLYPLDGDVQVAKAITDFGDTFSAGKDVIASAISAQAFQVPGVLNVTSVVLSLVGNPSQGSQIVITQRQIAVFDTSRVTVTSSDGTL